MEYIKTLLLVCITYDGHRRPPRFLSYPPYSFPFRSAFLHSSHSIRSTVGLFLFSECCSCCWRQHVSYSLCPLGHANDLTCFLWRWYGHMGPFPGVQCDRIGIHRVVHSETELRHHIHFPFSLTRPLKDIEHSRYSEETHLTLKPLTPEWFLTTCFSLAASSVVLGNWI